jgi:hypothetical protein
MAVYAAELIAGWATGMAFLMLMGKDAFAQAKVEDIHLSTRVEIIDSVTAAKERRKYTDFAWLLLPLSEIWHKSAAAHPTDDRY